MNYNTRLISLDLDCEEVIEQVRHRLKVFGVRTIRSFDLKSACASYPDLTCPHHENSPCDCQLVVLLAYGQRSSPASIIIHSHRGQTEVDLVDSPNNRPPKELVRIIHLAFEKGVGSPCLVNEVANVA